MVKNLALLALALGISQVSAEVPLWSQCGGSHYSGDTTCVSGSVCFRWNEFFSQCRPLSESFIKTSGTHFTLAGDIFTPVGSNSYWVGLNNLSDGDMNTTFHDVANAGGTVVRTWGFNELIGSPWAPYYQSWVDGVPTINYGATGLQNFDRVVQWAKANGIYLVVALTNNWADYGGMDVYVSQLLNSTAHDLFYTDETVKAAWKNYIDAFVGRYINETTIMAWELANEPRCRGSGGNTTGTCTPATITAWATEFSEYVKSIDPNHLVALGDEGFYNQPGPPWSYPYQGSEGIDFDANLAIASLDFGTFHSYPDSWVGGNYSDWGTQWIADHAASMKKANKPVILEEYGETNNQTVSYTDWLNEIVSSGLTGDLIWGIVSHLSVGDLFNDPLSIYPDNPIYGLLTDHAASLKARDAKVSL